MVDSPTSVMGRKPLAPNQRAQPISFSLRPHLIEQIDEYAHDLRFSRSKFLMEAVRKYMIRTDRDSSDDVENMSIDRRFVIGLNALREANQHNVTVKAQLIQMMKDELRITPEEYIEIGEFVAKEEPVDISHDPSGSINEIKTVKFDTGKYRVHRNEEPVAEIEKEGNNWRLFDLQTDETVIITRTLKSAKKVAVDVYEVV